MKGGMWNLRIYMWMNVVAAFLALIFLPPEERIAAIFPGGIAVFLFFLFLYVKYSEEDEIKNKPKNIEKEKLAISKMSANEILAYNCRTRKYEDEYTKYLFYAEAKAAYEGIKIQDWIDRDLERRKREEII